MELADKAKIFKAFCDEKRLQIIYLLQNGEKCTCKLVEEMQMPQSSLSYHMRILCDAGIVIGREEGKWTHYRICREQAETAVSLLKEILNYNG